MTLPITLLVASAHADEGCEIARTGLLVLDAPFAEDVHTRIDGVEVAPGTPRAVAAGRHVVEVRAGPAAPVTSVVDVAACGRVERLLDVESNAFTSDGLPVEAPIVGTLRFTGPGVGLATLDGRSARSGELVVPVGLHEIATAQDACVVPFRVHVRGGDTVTVTVAADGGWKATGADGHDAIAGGGFLTTCSGRSGVAAAAVPAGPADPLSDLDDAPAPLTRAGDR